MHTLRKRKQIIGKRNKQVVFSSNIDYEETRDRFYKNGIRILETDKGLTDIWLPFDVMLQISRKGTINVFYDSKSDPRYLQLGLPPRTFKDIILSIRKWPESGIVTVFTLEDLLKDKMNLFATTDNKPLDVKLKRQRYNLSAAADEFTALEYEYRQYKWAFEGKNYDFMNLMNILTRAIYDSDFRNRIKTKIEEYERYLFGPRKAIPTSRFAHNLFQYIKTAEEQFLPIYASRDNAEGNFLAGGFLEEENLLWEAAKGGRTVNEILAEVDTCGKNIKEILEERKAEYWPTLSEDERQAFEEFEEKLKFVRMVLPGETSEEQIARIEKTAEGFEALSKRLQGVFSRK